MGEMAEYMLNGDDCEGCGEYLGNGPGHPRRCRSCKAIAAKDAHPIGTGNQPPLVEKDYRWLDALAKRPNQVWSAAPHRFDKLHKRGLIECFIPNDPAAEKVARITIAGLAELKRHDGS